MDLLACVLFFGYASYDILELAVNIPGDAFAIHTKYPTPYSATVGPIKVFFINVKNCTIMLSF